MDRKGRNPVLTYAESGPLLSSAPPHPALQEGHEILHIGSGRRKIKGAVTLDINPRYRPDVIWDLNKFPFPFDRDSFDVVVCEHVIEHLRDVVHVMEELHRVTRPGGLVWVEVPHFSSLNANTDPTHTRRFSSLSMDYFCHDTDLSHYDYTTIRYRKLAACMSMRPRTRFNRLLMSLINSNLRFYEEHFAHIIPGQELLFVLEVEK